MSRDTLISAIRDLISEWEEIRDSEDGSVVLHSDILQGCIDDLKGILPPEE